MKIAKSSAVVSFEESPIAAPLERCLISLGANLGDHRRTMQSAALELIQAFGSKSVRFSQLYVTPAIGGPPGQNDFLNAVAEIDTPLSTFEIWQKLVTIENELGRLRRKRWEARRIDLDILLHGNQRIWTPTLKVPHPRMAMRSFVLEPAAELAADWIDPITHRTLEHLRDSLRAVRTQQTPLVISLLVDSQQCLKTIQEQLRAFNIHERVIEVSDPTELKLSANCQVRLLNVPIDFRGILDPRSQYEARRATWVNAIQQSPTPWNSPSLVMVCCRSPDPSTVHWEDYHRSSAELLRICPLEAPIPPFPWPPYLLASDDIQWASHEILAAIDAMTCPIEPEGSHIWHEEHSSKNGLA